MGTDCLQGHERDSFEREELQSEELQPEEPQPKELHSISFGGYLLY